MAWRIGVDIGGTFTDVVLVDEGTGRIGVADGYVTAEAARRDYGIAN
jgi:N-methylhydantoinase A/oxoprolinase/acetone carboxylase beta subunit